ncbi:MAG: hypothetical protein DWQ19_12895 [Crenarchaeota archaeon]|nr:MAG: hypothetical protein DWQ19_12895 [Thermoproteota archaeon]
MKRIRLKPKSKKGKDRIHQHGEIWEIVREQFFDGWPCFLIQSLENTIRQGNMLVKDLRLVRKQNDPNFEIEEV